ncbi:MAG: OmpH family outer membrane protein [Ignavibacteriota bacterium]
MQSTLLPRQQQAEKLNQELAQITQKLQNDASLTQQAQFDLNADGKRKQTELTRIQEDLQNDAQNMRQAVLARSTERMTTVVKKLAEEKGLDLVVDTQVALYFKPVMDITGDATAAYDKTYPAPAAPAAPPRSKIIAGSRKMAGYLDEYGAGDERRARIIKAIAVSVVVLAVLSGLLYFSFATIVRSNRQSASTNCSKRIITRRRMRCG